MSRLTERFGQNATTKEPCYIPAGIGKQEGNPLNEIVNKLGRLEDLADEGRLIVLPCKVGDTVYEVQEIRHRIQALEIISIHIGMMGEFFFNWEIKDGEGMYKNIKGFGLRHLGKTVFLTKAEAEAKLAELKGGEKDA